MPKPVSRFLVGLTGSSEDNGAVFSWDDATNTWTEMNVGKRTVRALAFYKDPVTGVDRVFAGSGNPHANGAIFSGVYDMSAPGQIRWNTQPEFTDFTHRVLAFVECNRRLYFAAHPSVYQRDDGPTPKWTMFYSYPGFIAKGSSGLRGLTCIPNPDGPGEVILAAMEGPGEVLRINPTTGQAITEFQIRRWLRKLWNVPPFYMAAAYNDMPLLRDPTSNERFHLMGLSIQCVTPDPCKPRGTENSTWYLTRDSKAHYSLFEVKPLGQKPLAAVRTIIESPFPEEIGKILYLGGYDNYNQQSHNTAWIYRVGIHTALSKKESSPVTATHD